MMVEYSMQVRTIHDGLERWRAAISRSPVPITSGTSQFRCAEKANTTDRLVMRGRKRGRVGDKKTKAIAGACGLIRGRSATQPTMQ